jgi:hypothetical protein
MIDLDISLRMIYALRAAEHDEQCVISRITCENRNNQSSSILDAIKKTPQQYSEFDLSEFEAIRKNRSTTIQ